MNCGDFEAIITDLAGEKLIDASRYKQALAHKNTCARCAARLANERSLTKALAVVANAETEQAPAHTKAALLQAFAQRTQNSAAPPIPFVSQTEAKSGSVVLFSPKAKNHLPSWLWTVAAAILLAVLGIAAMQILQSSSSQSGLQAHGLEPISLPKSKAQPQLPNKEKPIAIATVNVPKPRRRNTPLQTTMAPANNNRGQQQADDAEITTDYIPLTYVAGATAMESGQVVRVMMTRSSLLAYGLPVNLERDDEKIKADLVVGDDGLARAIRFVYPSKK